MSLLGLLRVLVIVVVSAQSPSLVSGAGETRQRLTSSPASVKPLQGSWKGQAVGEQGGSMVIVTIEGDSLRFYRDEDFWFDTKFTVSEAGESRKLRATILRCAPAQGESSIGKVVPALYRIDGKTLELAPYDEDELGAPKSLEEHQGTRYRLSQAVAGEADGEVDEVGESGSTLVEGPLP